MSLFSWLFGSTVQDGTRRLLDDGSEHDIVGEGNYQDALGSVCGGKTEEGVKHDCEAVLMPEDDNKYDSNAVKVTIDGRTVGYLSRSEALEYRKHIGRRSASCDAMIVGGWNRGRRGSGHFGVKLLIAWPPEFEE